MFFCKRDKIGRISRLALAAVLVLNTAMLGAAQLQTDILPDLAGDSAPCHMPQDSGEDHGGHSHSLACDSLCAQCIGFIPGSVGSDADVFTAVDLFVPAASDELSHYSSPPYKPPRA